MTLIVPVVGTSLYDIKQQQRAVPESRNKNKNIIPFRYGRPFFTAVTTIHHPYTMELDHENIEGIIFPIWMTTTTTTTTTTTATIPTILATTETTRRRTVVGTRQMTIQYFTIPKISDVQVRFIICY